MLRSIILAAAGIAAALPAIACDVPARQQVFFEFAKARQTEIPVQQPFPVADVAFQREDGTQGRIADVLGVPSVVTFWYPECAGCRADLPEYDAMLSEWGGRTDIQFLPLSIRGGANHAKNHLSSLGYSNVAAHSDERSRAFAANCAVATPTHFFVNAAGNVTAVLMGAQDWTGEDLQAKLNSHVAGEFPLR